MQSIRSLTQLNTLKLSRNRIEDPSGLVNLRALASLRILNISENPICKLPGHVDLCAYVCPALEVKKSTTVSCLPAQRFLVFGLQENHT